MARLTFTMPDIGEGIAEAEIVSWHVKVGDRVEEDQEVVDMMTDKATVPMESPYTGTVVEVAGEPGDMVAIGSVLFVVEGEGQEGAPDAEADEPAQDRSAENALEVTAPELPKAEAIAAPEPVSSPQANAPKVLASPAVRRRARELGIDLAEVRAAGDGRVRHADLDAYLSYNGAGGFAPAGMSRPDEMVKVIGLRKRIAQNMAASKRNIPHFSYVEEVDVTDLETMRSDLNAHRARRQAQDDRDIQPKLTMMPLLIAAICKLVPQFPMINARYDDEAGIVARSGAVHLGMATQTDNGLMVPVIRDAQAKNLWQLAREIQRLANAARDGTARSDELSGSTLTLTSLGPLGGVATTPVINRPEVAIIGPNRIIERPMYVADGNGGERIEKRKLMNISISCDHRVVDGYDAASFIQEMKKLIETPIFLLTD